MSTPNAKDILVAVPGRLVINPGGFGGVFPYGGTALGIVKAIAVRPGVTYEEVTAEEYGGERVEVIATGEAWTLAAVLRSWDSDGVTRVFPTTSVPGSGIPQVRHPNTADANAGRAGRIMSDSSVVLAFCPDAPLVHPGVVFHRAIPLLAEQAEMQLSLARPTELAVVFAAIRSATGKSVTIGRLSEIAL